MFPVLIYVSINDTYVYVYIFNSVIALMSIAFLGHVLA